MKKFAFPLSIKCANEAESDQCTKLLESIGYNDGGLRGTRRLIATNYSAISSEYASISDFTKFKNDRHHIDHFNPELIRDIAAACTNDTWQIDEPKISLDQRKLKKSYIGITGDNSLNKSGILVSKTEFYMRPTLAEICEHHGYEIKGRDIVRKDPVRKEPEIIAKVISAKDNESGFTVTLEPLIPIDEFMKLVNNEDPKIETTPNCHESYSGVACCVQIENKALKAENERLRNEITAWQTKYEAIKEVVNR